MSFVRAQFKDFDEYEARYSSDNNPEYFTIRFPFAQKLNRLGWLVK